MLNNLLRKFRVAGFAMGPSRVNPITGEILDADIIFDATFVRSWRFTFDKIITDLLPPDSKKMSDDELINFILQKNGKQNTNEILNQNIFSHENDCDHKHGEIHDAHECSINDGGLYSLHLKFRFWSFDRRN